MSTKKKIGIMGGTFNPVHNGHLMIAEAAGKDFELDEILFMPSGISYQKKGKEVADPGIRAQMTALAIEGNPMFRLSTMEIDRKGNTYSYETIELLCEESPDHEYYFIIGADTLFTIETWKYPERILSRCVLLAALRGDSDVADMQEQIVRLQHKYQADIRLIPMDKVFISSTMIRQRIKAGESIRELVPDKVLRFIEQERLYQSL